MHVKSLDPIFFVKFKVHIDHSELRCLMAKRDLNWSLIRWVLLLQEFDCELNDRKN